MSCDCKQHRPITFTLYDEDGFPYVYYLIRELTDDEKIHITELIKKYKECNNIDDYIYSYLLNDLSVVNTHYSVEYIVDMTTSDYRVVEC